jgi:hypothetical protein
MTENLKRCIRWILLCLVATLCGFCATDCLYPQTLGPADVVYQGSFRLPQGILSPQKSWDGTSIGTFAYSSGKVAFRPGALFFCGHNYAHLVAELAIPASLAGSPVATLLQAFGDAPEGRHGQLSATGSIQMGGLLVYGTKLIGTSYIFYDANNAATTSHWTSGLSLAPAGDATGMHAIAGAAPRFLAGYMCVIPQDWASKIGKPCVTGLAGVAIQSGASYGPSAVAFDPAELGTLPAPSKPLVFYDLAHKLAEETSQNPLYNLCTEVRGVAWPEGSNTLLFWGSHGLGAYCYGTPTQCGGDVARGDNSKGPHMAPYRYQFWAYAASDVEAVSKGTKQPWEPRPVVWNPAIPNAPAGALAGGMAYDPSTRRLYCVANYSDGAYPLVHVFQVAGSVVEEPPPPPPVPTRAVVSFALPPLDLNGLPTTITSAQIRFVAKDAKSSGAAVVPPITWTPAPGTTTASYDVASAIVGLAPGEYHGWLRLRNAQGWGAYLGAPIAVAVPITGSQPAAPAIPASTPVRPSAGKIEVK